MCKTFATAVNLFGLIYALNVNYPQELKYTFEKIQKYLLFLTPSAQQESGPSKKVLMFK